MWTYEVGDRILVVSSETGGFAENHFVLKKEFEGSELKAGPAGE